MSELSGCVAFCDLRGSPPLPRPTREECSGVRRFKAGTGRNRAVPFREQFRALATKAGPKEILSRSAPEQREDFVAGNRRFQ